MKRSEELALQIKMLQYERREALEEEAKDAILKATVYDVAELLHSKRCTSSHTDGCPWGYETHEPDMWSKWAHAEYLKRATAICELIEPPVAMRVIDLI